MRSMNSTSSRVMTDRTPALAARVQEFAQELTDTLTGVLRRPVGFVVKVGESTKRPQVSIMQSDDTGVPLTVDGHVLFRLLVRFRCRWDTTGDFLAVEESSFTVALDQVNEPIFHFDYVREPRGAVPVAHLNVHAHRDDIIWAMLMARAKRGSAVCSKRRTVGSPGSPPCTSHSVATDTGPRWKTSSRCSSRSSGSITQPTPAR